MTVRFSPRAANDLARILDYLAERSPRGARNVGRAIQHTIDQIGERPGAGREAGRGAVRVLPVASYPYLVYWTVQADDAYLVHIRHGARKSWRN